MSTSKVETFVGSSLLAALIAALALAFPTVAGAATPKLVASVGPGHTISLRTASGAPVRSIKAGTYTIVVRDRASDHDFRLVGPGLNKVTGVGWVGTKTWRVRFLRGKTYRFVCDPHADEMRGAFRVR
jgi:ABC-type Zn2+ transport system substrate-binding protein/surface adhesin